MIKIFTHEMLENLIAEAKSSTRLRKHQNIHADYVDPCQRLFNAIEPDSYIQPHRHCLEPRAETMIAVRGLMALVLFDDLGNIVESTRFGARVGEGHALGVEVPPGIWHTVVALENGSVLFEVKAGPFDPDQPKEFAQWAPEEGSIEARHYQRALVRLVHEFDFRG